MSNTKFEDTSKEVIDELKNLSKKALRASAKIVTKQIRAKVPKRSGAFRKSIASWSRIDRATGQPILDIGYLSRKQTAKKYGIKYFANPAWFEFGTKSHSIVSGIRRGTPTGKRALSDHRSIYGGAVINKGMGSKNFLRNTVFENISAIHNAQQEYLKQITTIAIKQGYSIPDLYDEEVDYDD